MTFVYVFTHFVIIRRKRRGITPLEIKGFIDEVPIDYRLIIKRAIFSEATSIICSHNHPSGNVDPSTQDRTITLELKKKDGNSQY